MDQETSSSDRGRGPLLIVEDDLTLQKQMRWAFDAGETLLASDPTGALEQVRARRPAVVTMDLGLPPHPDDATEGFRLLADILAEAPNTKVIVLTGQNDRENALKAVQLGAYDFFAKPFAPELLGVTIDRAFRLHELQEENRRLVATHVAGGFAHVLTRDPDMLRIGRTIEKIAPSDATVLINGESGTGKELVARALHEQSRRAAGRWVAINCAAIPEQLLESELFGHEKGSFTGATRDAIGKFELADGGTLFLDEIGDLSHSLQAKLLRFLQERIIERVGGREEIAVDVRILCATHRNLPAMIKEGTFREDLYFRLAEITLEIPPLRERDGDALLLARHFVGKFAAELRRPGMVLQPDAAAAIAAWRWPGNVRELENCIKRAVIMADGSHIGRADLGLPETESAGGDSLNLRQIRDVAERQAVVRVLDRERGNLSSAARVLGISRPTLYELIERFGLKQASKA